MGVENSNQKNSLTQNEQVTKYIATMIWQIKIQEESSLLQTSISKSTCGDICTTFKEVFRRFGSSKTLSKLTTGP